MKILLVYIIFFFSSVSAIGLNGIDIPINTIDLSLSSSGIGSNNNIFLNPASTNHYNGSSIGFSSNRWIQGLNGNSIYFSSNSLLLSFTSIGIDDIEIRDEIASEDPIDIVSANFIDFKLSKSIKLKKNLHAGISTDMIFSQVFSDNTFDITFSFGLKKYISDRLKAGILIKNFGSMVDEISSMHGIGVSYIFKTNTELITDINYSSNNGIGFHMGMIQTISKLTLRGAYSHYDNRTAVSSGLGVDITKKINFTYSLLLIPGSGLGPAHYFGLNFTL